MILVIGGRAQGKLDWAKHAFGLSDGDIAVTLADAVSKKALYGVTSIVRAILENGGEPSAEFDALFKANPGLIVIADEIGCGIVPIDPAERRWRDAAGSVATMAASRSEQVIRIFCGIPSLLKGVRTWS